jgi:hypothetical protein
MADWSELHAPKPGDLCYQRDPNTGEVFTQQVWTVLVNEGTVPGEQIPGAMPWKTYWSLQVMGDGRCAELGFDDCEGGPSVHFFWWSADDFVLAVNV